MDFSVIMEAITTVGFPVVCCAVMAWFCKYQMDKFQASLDAINQRHKEETDKMTEAIQNNTKVMEELILKMGGSTVVHAEVK